MPGQNLNTAIVPLPGGAFAVYISGGLVQYNHADWLGSARLFSTPSRGAVPAMAYAPFGEGYTSVADGYVQFTSAGNGANRAYRAAKKGLPQGQGFPFLMPPYGDQSSDQKQIAQGFAYNRSGTGCQ